MHTSEISIPVGTYRYLGTVLSFDEMIPIPIQPQKNTDTDSPAMTVLVYIPIGLTGTACINIIPVPVYYFGHILEPVGIRTITIYR